MSTAMIVWLSLGIGLILMEFIIPGGIVAFLGLAALVVAALLHFDLVTNIIYLITTWFIVSLFMIFVIRTFFMRWFPGNETIQDTDEDLQCIGSVVTVVETITPYQEGRIRFRETTWVAQSQFEIAPGQRAVIENRNGNKWIVKPI